MRKKEMEKRIHRLEEQLRRTERRRCLEVKVIQNMAKKLHFDLDELLRGSSQPGKNYRNEQIPPEKEEKDLSREILKMIFDERLDGVSVEEIRDILNEALDLAENIPMV